MSHLLLQGDARRIPLPDGSVHCVVTSPPYYGLRDYGTGRWEGGDAACDHKVERNQDFKRRDTACKRTDIFHGSTLENELASPQFRDLCSKCGARRIDAQLGLEASPDEYIAGMVRVFREVKRVLRNDGTAWMNMGDSYAGNGPVSQEQTSADIRHAKIGNALAKVQRRIGTITGLKPKDLCGMPWRVAFALQADGWTLRSDVIWAKPNPMPESVTDRPTKSHKYLFMLSKSGTTQFWTHRDHGGVRSQPQPDYRWVHEDTDEERASEPPGWREKGSPWGRVNLWHGRDYYWDAEAVKEPHKTINDPRNRNDYQAIRGMSVGGGINDGRIRTSGPSTWPEAGRNMRSVLTIATEAWPGAHFATFPRKLVEPCIQAGTSEKGCCPRCGAPWTRQVEIKGGLIGKSWLDHQADLTIGNSQCFRADGGNQPYQRISLGWQSSCTHRLDPVPCTVLDPFVGSGTSIVVALALGRRAIGLDLSRAYLTQQAQRRIERPHAPVVRPGRTEFMPLFGDTT